MARPKVVARYSNYPAHVLSIFQGVELLSGPLSGEEEAANILETEWFRRAEGMYVEMEGLSTPEGACVPGIGSTS